MKNKTTIFLSIVFLLLLGTFVSIQFGIVKLPWSLGAKQNPILAMTASKNNNGNTNSSPTIRIKRPTSATYETAMKDGDTYFQAGDYQNAIEEYTRATTFESTRSEPYQKLGETATLLGDFEKAGEYFQFALDRNPQDEGIKLAMVRLNIKKSDFTTALDVLLGMNSENQEVRYYIGLLRARSGDMEKAQNNLRKSVELDPQSTTGQRAQNVLNNIEEFNLFSDGKQTHLKTLVSRAFIQNGEYQLAIGTLKDVLKENKNYRDAWVLLGFSYYAIQKYDLALETLNNAYDLDPEKNETQYFLALVHQKLGNIDKALTYLILAEKNGFEPKNDVQRRMADLYLGQEKYDEALSGYLALIKDANIKDINLYVRPMWIYIEIKNEPLKALELAKEAFDLFPDNAMAYNLVGWGDLHNGNLEEAEKYLTEAEKRDPNLQAVYLNLGDLYKEKQDLAKSQDYYKRAYFMDKNSSIGVSAGNKYNELVGEQ